MIDVFNEIKRNKHLFKAKICNFIYDEIIMECPESLSDQYRLILEQCMKNAANYYIDYDIEINMTCTANIGKSWYEIK